MTSPRHLETVVSGALFGRQAAAQDEAAILDLVEHQFTEFVSEVFLPQRFAAFHSPVIPHHALDM